jgi:hypothetical protein
VEDQVDLQIVELLVVEEQEVIELLFQEEQKFH